MAYDKDLANRLRALLGDEEGLTEQRMFGGLAFLVHGHMAVAASSRGGLLLRVDPAETDTLATRPGVEPFVMRGRQMDGWLRIPAEAVATRRQLAAWVRRGIIHARSLPPKR